MTKNRDEPAKFADMDGYESSLKGVRMAKRDMLETLELLNETIPDETFGLEFPEPNNYRYELYNSTWCICRTRTAHEMFRFIQGMLAMYYMTTHKE